jgi:beta-1,4-mannosyl-glycoprotein beta-1,4-N-acetylglucosaminyltransferase
MNKLKPTITFVTAFIDLYEDRSKDKSVEKYITYFKQLATSGIHICLYVSALYEKHGLELQSSFPNVKLIKVINLEETITYKLIQSNNPLLPANRTEYHDTMNFINLSNTKCEFVYKASLINPFDTDHFAWIDFGICHVIKNIEYTLSRLYTFSCSQLKSSMLAIPGCWSKDYSDIMIPYISSQIHWRFCGGFFLGDKQSITHMYEKIIESIPIFIKQYSTIVWEANMWTWAEKNMNIKINWYEANHDDSMLMIPSEYIKIVASLSSIPSRFNTINLVIDSLLTQVDHLYLNLCENYLRFPSYKKDNTLAYLLTEEPYKTKVTVLYGTDFGPGTKYLGALDHIGQNQWIFFCDDDQEYHTELINNMKNKIHHLGVYQNRYNHVTANGSGGVIHGYVGNMIHRSFINNLLKFPLPDSARFVDDQWMSIFFYKNNIKCYPTGIEAYNDIYKICYNGHEKLSVDSLSALNNRDIYVKSLEDYFKIKFIERGCIINIPQTISQSNFNTKNIPDCTLVTACYNLSKYHNKVRTIDDILKSFDTVLQLPVYLVIFSDKLLLDIIKQKRLSYGMEHLTYFIEMEVEQLWTFQFHQKVKNNRERKWATRDERTCSETHLVNCNKMDFVLKTMDINPFKTSKFGWLDAFLGQDNKLKICEEYTLNKFLYVLQNITNKFHIQILAGNDKKYKNNDLIDEYYQQYRYVVCGGFFTCGSEIGIKILNRLKEIFVETTELGYGHGEEMLYLKVLDEFYDDIARSYGDYGQIINNFIEPTKNFPYINNFILKKYLDFGYHRECYDCATIILKQIETYKVEVDRSIYMNILFCYYVAAFYYKPEEVLRICNHIYDIIYINPYMLIEFNKNKDFYHSQLKYCNQYKPHEKLVICVFGCATIPGYKNEILKIEETWGKCATQMGIKVLYFLGEEKTDLIDETKFIYLKGVKNDYLSASEKQNLGLKYIYNHFNADFVFCCGTDTYINMKKLVKYIEQFDPNKNLYIGGHGDIIPIHNKPYYFHSGGAGFILSKECLHNIYLELHHMLNEWKSVCKNAREYLIPESCDVTISYFLQNKLQGNLDIIKDNNIFFGCNYKGICCSKIRQINNIMTCHNMKLTDFDDYTNLLETNDFFLSNYYQVNDSSTSTINIDKKIIDCFIFYNELDLLNYRLNILNNVVDYFIIVEATHTFTGRCKSLIYNENKHLFEKYQDKIILITVDDLPYKYPNINFSNNEQWTNEHYQRNCIHNGLNKLILTDKDIIIISDLDEIPDPDTLLKIKKGDVDIEINILELDFYYYNLNSKFKNKWDLSKIISYKKYKELSISCNAIRGYSCLSIKNGGWHLSYFGDSTFIKNKIEAFSHQELNNDKFKNIENINKHIQNCSDLFDRYDCNITHISIKDNNYLPPEYEKYLHKFIVNNI